MKVLIVGDNPNFKGGVCNYTRPLFEGLRERRIDVSYLYSASRLKADYRLYGDTFIEEDSSYDGLYKIVNSDNLDLNYDRLDLDIESKYNDDVVLKYLSDSKPDLVHINEIIGFSSNIITICNELSIPVIVTVHEYWWLCPKRVMVDYNRKVCSGPVDLERCSYCISKVQDNYSSKNRKNSYKLNKILDNFNLTWIKELKNMFSKSEINEVALENLEFGDSDYRRVEENVTILSERLETNITRLNGCAKVICVSEDVKKHLSRFGVNEAVLHVQHIGSLIGDRRIKHTKEVEDSCIRFGFIGGVSYYKGVHQLVEAFRQLPKAAKDKAELHLYGSGSPSYMAALKNLAVSEIKNNKIFLYGRFEHTQLEEITNKVDIAVLPSLCADTAPQTIFESFSCGLPVIAPSIGGFSDFVHDGYNGLIFKGADIKSLSEKMLSVIEEPSMLSHFKKNISSPKSMTQHLIEIEQTYKEILNTTSLEDTCDKR